MLDLYIQALRNVPFYLFFKHELKHKNNESLQTFLTKMMQQLGVFLNMEQQKSS